MRLTNATCRPPIKPIEVSVVAHMFDLANDLKLQPPERLLEPDILRAYTAAMTKLLNDRFALAADGSALNNSRAFAL